MVKISKKCQSSSLKVLNSVHNCRAIQDWEQRLAMLVTLQNEMCLCVCVFVVGDECVCAIESHKHGCMFVWAKPEED